MIKTKLEDEEFALTRTGARYKYDHVHYIHYHCRAAEYAYALAGDLELVNHEQHWCAVRPQFSPAAQVAEDEQRGGYRESGSLTSARRRMNGMS